MTSEEICKAYLGAVRTLYGKEIANKSRCDYGKGWYYINVARRFSDGSIGFGGIRASCYRSKNVMEMTQRLLERAKDKE